MSIGPGTILVGRYELERELGKGGMGAVYAARDLKLGGQRVAVKVAAASGTAHGEFRARFAREAAVGGRLGRLPGFVRALDWGELEDGVRLYLTMDLVEDARPLDLEGGTRAERLRRLLRATELVATAHAQGVVHRDLKPANFLQPPDGALHLSDFGLAKTPDTDEAGGSTLVTQSGIGLGTPLFMAPEQFEDAKRVDARADVFALGVMLFRALTGTWPYDAPDFRGIVMRHMKVTSGAEPAPRARDVDRSVSKALDELCARAMALKVDERLQTADELAAGLRAALEPEATAVQLAPPPALEGKKKKRRPGEGSEPRAGRAHDAPPLPRPPRSPWPRAQVAALAGVGLAVVGLGLVMFATALSERPPRAPSTTGTDVAGVATTDTGRRSTEPPPAGPADALLATARHLAEEEKFREAVTMLRAAPAELRHHVAADLRRWERLTAFRRELDIATRALERREPTALRKLLADVDADRSLAEDPLVARLTEEPRRRLKDLPPVVQPTQTAIAATEPAPAPDGSPEDERALRAARERLERASRAAADERAQAARAASAARERALAATHLTPIVLGRQRFMVDDWTEDGFAVQVDGARQEYAWETAPAELALRVLRAGEPDLHARELGVRALELGLPSVAREQFRHERTIQARADVVGRLESLALRDAALSELRMTLDAGKLFYVREPAPTVRTEPAGAFTLEWKRSEPGLLWTTQFWESATVEVQLPEPTTGGPHLVGVGNALDAPLVSTLGAHLRLLRVEGDELVPVADRERERGSERLTLEFEVRGGRLTTKVKRTPSGAPLLEHAVPWQADGFQVVVGASGLAGIRFKQVTVSGVLSRAESARLRADLTTECLQLAAVLRAEVAPPDRLPASLGPTSLEDEAALRAVPAAVRDHPKRARAALEAGDVLTAMALLEEAGRLAPAFDAARLVAALVVTDLSAAEGLWLGTALAEEHPRAPEPHLLRARAALTLMRDDVAAEALARALALRPDLVPAHVTATDLALRRGDARAARQAARLALALAPADLEARVAVRRALALTSPPFHGGTRVAIQGLTVEAQAPLDAKRVADELLAVRALLVERVVAPFEARAARVVVFSSGGDYSRFCHALFGGPPGADARYHAPTGVLVGLLAHPWSSHELLHESAHLWLRQGGACPPPWLDEGLADHLAHEVWQRHMRGPSHRLASDLRLLGAAWAARDPLEALTRHTAAELHAPQRRAVRIVQAGALVRMMLDDPRLTTVLQTYLREHARAPLEARLSATELRTLEAKFAEWTPELAKRAGAPFPR